jgi:hypothetical protein
MPDEITKPIEEKVTTETPPIESSEPTVVTSPSLEPIPTEPTVVPTITPEVSSEPVLDSTSKLETNHSSLEPNLVTAESPLITSPSPLEPNSVGDGAVDAEPAGEAAGSDTVGTELPNEVSRPYSLDPKLNKIIEGFVRNMNKAKENLILANASIKAKMMKRVYKVMDLFKKKKKIKNDDVEKLIHTDDSTTTRYLNILTKEGKIKREGKPHTPYYTKVE